MSTLKKYFRIGVIVAANLSVMVVVMASAAAPSEAVVVGAIERVSVDSNGAQANGGSFHLSISGDGRYVVFDSDATNLVANDSNNSRDTFIRDLQAGAQSTTRTSIASDGTQANGGSFNPSVSGDGRYVAFESDASNLVANDTNNSRDVFVRDRQTGTTTRVSVDSNGKQANGASYNPVISGDGKFVAFQSIATNLVANDTNNFSDVFVRDMTAGTTTRVSVSSNGAEANGGSFNPSISGDGRFVAFDSDATNLVANDTNAVQDVFVRDRQAGTTTRVSVDSNGKQANGNSYNASVSSDGKSVAFESDATNLVANDTNNSRDVFVRDQTAGTTTRVSADSNGAQANGDSFNPSISGDGKLVAFESDATNLVANDTNNSRDVFVRDQTAGTTTRVSVDSNGAQANNGSHLPKISSDGKFVAFESDASNLVANDTNNSTDVFRVPIAGNRKLGVLPANSFVFPVMQGMVGQIPDLTVVTVDTTNGTFSVPGCSTVTSPLPATAQDYLSMLSGQPYLSVGGATVGPLTLDCIPDAVTTYFNP